MMLICGLLYQTTKDTVLLRHEEGRNPAPVGVTISTTLMARGIKAYYSQEMAQDFAAFHGLDAADFGHFVPNGSLVMYLDTGKTGSYKLIYGEMVGWTNQTLNLLKEISE